MIYLFDTCTGPWHRTFAFSLCKMLTIVLILKSTHQNVRRPLLLKMQFYRESEGTVIKITDLMQLNKDAARKFELGGGVCHWSNVLSISWQCNLPIYPFIFATLFLEQPSLCMILSNVKMFFSIMSTYITIIYLNRKSHTPATFYQALFFYNAFKLMHHTMQTIFWLIFKNNIRGNFSQSKGGSMRLGH